ncbi:hypothetical protein SAMN04515666_103617 [Bosea lupini]|uniref:Uncharacterized protein n=1 Tax=Bosea lupini TaxID=1036779 RepID=A0A1H7PVR3_9HYPH|nr:hypothetical protein [Bosea lupini]SEL39558.1 hypothetical protein SAMN04515666_103617 [Bosea lupini]
MGEFWNSLTQGQGTVISGFLTLLAAITGVLIGSWLFGSRVKDLKSAVDASDQLLRKHGSEVDATLAAIRDKISEMQKSFATTSEQLNDLRGSVADLEAASSPETVTEPVQAGTEEQPSPREQIRQGWLTVRDALEHIAARPQIDGRTRARYARIDRRRYPQLVEALAADGLLAANADAFWEASALWQAYRGGRSEPTAREITRMSELAAIAAATAARTD